VVRKIEKKKKKIKKENRRKFEKNELWKLKKK